MKARTKKDKQSLTPPLRSTDKKRKLGSSRSDYPEDFMYSAKKRRTWNEEDYQGGIFSDSEVGGAAQSQQNGWQGSQQQAKSEDP